MEKESKEEREREPPRDVHPRARDFMSRGRGGSPHLRTKEPKLDPYRRESFRKAQQSLLERQQREKAQIESYGEKLRKCQTKHVKELWSHLQGTPQSTQNTETVQPTKFRFFIFKLNP